MKVLELIDLLLTLPGDTEVYVGDTRYNGDEEVSNYDDPVLLFDKHLSDLYILANNGSCHTEFTVFWQELVKEVKSN